MIKIKNVHVCGLRESIRRAKYPMSVDPASLNDTLTEGIKRLAKSKAGEGHDQWLTGVIVQFDVTGSLKWWTEAQRYHFLDFVSSQSTMHRITKFDLGKQYCEYVDPRVIEIMQEKVAAYNKLVENKPGPDAAPELLKDYAILLKEKYLEILYTNPAGFELTARMTTNYRCLLNIYIQRHDHRLPEWREFCERLLELPYFADLVNAYNGGEIKI